MPTQSSRKFLCRQCRTEIYGLPHLRLGYGLHGHSVLCLPCADKQMAKMHKPTLGEFVPAYMRAEKHVTTEAQLRAEVQELRTMLEQLTAPQNGSTTAERINHAD